MLEGSDAEGLADRAGGRQGGTIPGGLLAIPEGGQSEAAKAAVRITGANAVTFIVTAATSFVNYHDISGDPAARLPEGPRGRKRVDYATLRRRHEEDFRRLMGRVHLNVGDGSINERPTGRAARGMSAGAATDANLEALCFQFGRYILVSSSRAGGQPANLQGIWNEAVSPPWGSKYTININTEMNYWPAEVCNLSECHQPLFDMLKDISVTGPRRPRCTTAVSGWVAHHNIDLWRGTAPVDAARFGMWPVGGAWLCQHLWEHYAFTGDTEFLKEYYPVMKGSAQFLLEVMVEEPKHHWLVTPFSMSPEHGYLRQQRQDGLSLSLADDGHRHHPRAVSALHRGQPDCWAWTRSSAASWRPPSPGFRLTGSTTWAISRNGSKTGSRRSGA